MDEDYYYGYSKNSGGQIPVFGEWDYANDLPITQYFESARQAGLIRFSSSSGSGGCDPPAAATNNNADLYAPPRKTRAREKRRLPAKEQKKAGTGRICDGTQPPTRLRHVAQRHATDGDKLHRRNDVVSYPRPRLAAAKPQKAVDEDLYKIPAELLHTSTTTTTTTTTNRKKRLGFIPRCLVPACSA